MVAGQVSSMITLKDARVLTDLLHGELGILLLQLLVLVVAEEHPAIHRAGWLLLSDSGRPATAAGRFLRDCWEGGIWIHTADDVAGRHDVKLAEDGFVAGMRDASGLDTEGEALDIIVDSKSAS